MLTYLRGLKAAALCLTHRPGMTAIAVAVLFCRNAGAVSTLPFYEPFPISYGNGTLMGVGSTTNVWDIGNSGTSGATVVTNVAAQTYSGLTNSGSSLGLLIAGTPGSARNKGATFTSQTPGAANPTVYASFLLKVEAAPSADRLFAGLSSTGTGTTASGVVGLWVNSASQLLISKNSNTTPAATNTAALSSGTHLVVLRYKWNTASGDDEVALWVDPGSLGAAEGSVPAPDISTTTGTDVSPVQSFWIFHPTTATVAATLDVDEIRAGTNWADVTPTGSSAPPPTGQPIITQTWLTESGLVILGTNGPATGICQMLCVTNVTTPIAQWPVIGTNSFDANGNFNYTNPVPPGDPLRFYRVRVGTNGAVSPVAPGISAQPQDVTIAVGQNAPFSVTATGTAPLAYRWFFNTNTALANATNTTYTVTNAQLTNAGQYSVTVTNAAGATNSAFATLTVTNPIFAPVISNQPADVSVTVSNNATFSVVAGGTAPLSYQWYFNTNTPLPNATNASLTVSNAQFASAGKYSVTITNVAGATNSAFATLTVVSNSNTPNFSMVGFATLNGFSSTSTLLTGGTTGGSNGPIVLVSNVTQLVNYATKSNQALRILILTNIDMGPLNNNDNPTNILPTGKIVIKSHKTIYSTNGVTISHGSFHVIGQSNVIIRNLKFRDLFFENSGADPGYDNHDWDYVRVDTGHHVWVDHCDFNQSYDGMVDIKDRGDYVTVSWCIFSNQKKCSLVGSSDTSTADITHFNVTFHHNWYINVIDRTPRMRFGNAHVFNLYSQNLTGKAVQSTCQASVLMENSYFQSTSGGHPDVSNNGDSPPAPYSPDGAVKVVSSLINPAGSASFVQNANTNYFLGVGYFSFNPPFAVTNVPYAYSNVLDTAANVPNIVTNWAGTGKLTSF